MLETTIKNALDKKIKSWLYTIKDKELVEAIKKDLIISGGAITSMMQNEEPNDYDCYFKTKETLLRVIRMYLPEFSNYSKECDKVIEKEDGQIKIFISSRGFLSQKLSPEDIEKKVKYKPLFVSSNALSLSDGIQLISRFYGEAEELHKNFDFIHTKAYYDIANNNLEIPKSVYESVMNKRLIFTNSKYPICSLFRIKKFLKRGWNISAGEIFKISYAISKFDLDEISTLEDQLIGVDSYYFMKLIEDLKNKLEINETAVLQAVEKVFASINE